MQEETKVPPSYVRYPRSRAATVTLDYDEKLERLLVLKSARSSGGIGTFIGTLLVLLLKDNHSIKHLISAAICAVVLGVFVGASYRKINYFAKWDRSVSLVAGVIAGLSLAIPAILGLSLLATDLVCVITLIGLSIPLGRTLRREQVSHGIRSRWPTKVDKLIDQAIAERRALLANSMPLNPAQISYSEPPKF